LAELGIQEKHIDPLANDALAQTRLLINNPKTVSLEDAKQIYLNALTGKRNG
jgi:alcohol dehydrogenase